MCAYAPAYCREGSPEQEHRQSLLRVPYIRNELTECDTITAATAINTTTARAPTTTKQVFV